MWRVYRMVNEDRRRALAALNCRLEMTDDQAQAQAQRSCFTFDSGPNLSYSAFTPDAYRQKPQGASSPPFRGSRGEPSGLARQHRRDRTAPRRVRKDAPATPQRVRRRGLAAELKPRGSGPAAVHPQQRRDMTGDNPLERAFELARSGQCSDLRDREVKLKRVGFAWADTSRRSVDTATTQS